LLLITSTENHGLYLILGYYNKYYTSLEYGIST